MHNRYDDPEYAEVVRSLKMQLKDQREEIGDTDSDNARIQKIILANP